MKTKIKTRHKADKDMINDCIRNYSHFSFDENSVVLDLGCNVGGMMHWLADIDIKQYIGFDALSENVEFFKENNLPDKSNYEVFHGAASTSTDPEITFHINPEMRGTTNGQTHPTRRQKQHRSVALTVPNYNIDALIQLYKPTHLKLDIKGTEMVWFESTGGKLPFCVQEFFVEVYTRKGAIRYDTEFFPLQLEEFVVQYTYPTERFKGMGNWYSLPNLGHPDVNAQLYDVNVLLKRKH
tara:strand:+ start:672 stop:1388 length:717 start_codon:yes stop_codon:yes gene_type:complete